MITRKPAILPNDLGPTSSSFDISDRYSMGDLEYVTVRLGKMFDEHRNILFNAPNPQAAIPAFVAKWTDELWPGNPDVIQIMSMDGLNVWLRSKGLDSEGTDPKGPVKALVAHLLGRNLEAIMLFHEGEIDADQFSFNTECTLEDGAKLLQGLDNPAD